MKKHISLILLFCVLCSILSGCGKQAGSEFVGTWKYSGIYRGEHYEKEKDNNFLYIRVFYFIRRLFFS